jgi:hypothetical protein
VDPPCCAIAQTHFAKAMPWHPQHMKHHYCSALFPTPWFPFFFPNMAALLSLSLSLSLSLAEKKEMWGLRIESGGEKGTSYSLPQPLELAHLLALPYPMCWSEMSPVHAHGS